jgi:predicted secreted hydrolase
MISQIWRLVALFASLMVISACAVADDPAGERNISDEQDRPADLLLAERTDPQPISLPDDASPHDRLTEWWYYTGHVQDEEGYLYGFQFVIFQVQRGEFPPTWAAHFAATDTRTGNFSFEERIDAFQYELGEEPFDLTIGDWRLTGGDGLDRIQADMDGYSIDVELGYEKEPVLHEGDGYFEFAPGAESYYYSRTRMSAHGTLDVNSTEREISGQAWFDQQWGDFLVLDSIGWDWFSVQLDNGTEVMAWQSHDTAGTILDGNASIVAEDGSVNDIPGEELSIVPLDEWQSPISGGVYPMGWIIEIESEDLWLKIDPVMEHQELITLESTGVIYWEGMVEISGIWQDEPVSGLGYVELTGYADVGQSTDD